MMRSRSIPARACVALAACLWTALATAMPWQPAAAQVIALSVNGDPITSVDLDQRMKLLRGMRRPASREAATESMIQTRLKSREATHLGINIGDNEIGEEVQSFAKKAKTTPQALLTAINAAGVSQEHVRNFFKAELGYSILIKALNRGVEASEVAVRRELAKEKGKGAAVSYTIRQVVFTVSPSDGPAALAASAKQAEALRTKFSNCTDGLPYAKTLPGVAVREQLTRSSSALPDNIKELLDKTPVGHLTPPTRSPNGIELIAVCARSAGGSDEDLRRTIADRLLAEHLDQTEAEKYKDLRAHAVVRKTQ